MHEMVDLSIPGYYGGIGSRSTPAPMLNVIEQVAWALAQMGWTLRSGHAEGADYAFERGAGGAAEIFKPWWSYNQHLPIVVGHHRTPAVFDRPTADAIDMAVGLHPLGVGLRQGPRLLHGRNAHQMLGYSLREPVRFALCWTANGSLDGSERGTGGTGGALRIAALNEIPVLNLAREDHLAWILGPHALSSSIRATT